MFPTLPINTSVEMEELCVDIVRQSSALGRGLAQNVLAAVSRVITPVMSYYTNAMEGNPSRLVDIENAMRKNFSRDADKRNYQREHLAHIAVHKMMMRRLSADSSLDVTSPDFLLWLHGEFYRRLPEEMHFAKMVDGAKVRIKPGEFRSKGALVGRHAAPETTAAIKTCLQDFNRDYRPTALSAVTRVVALAASHHRLLWIHPFSDGNGRVARLFTEAYAVAIGLNRNGLWTVTRAFARNRADYDRNLALADESRLNDYDGRGPLSARRLAEFCAYFLRCCLDQIGYMESVLELELFRQRGERFLAMLVGERKLSKSGAGVLRELLHEGEVGRGDVAAICGVRERRASQIIGALLTAHWAVSPSAYGRLRLHITAAMAAQLLPKLV